MCDQVVLYDQDQDGLMTESTVDFEDPASFEDDLVLKNRLKYVYRYGITMLTSGLVSSMQHLRASPKSSPLPRPCSPSS